MYFATLFGTVLAVIGTVRAQAGAYQQCGGSSWTGTTTCVSGYSCSEVNSYYSQCTPSSAGAAETTAAAPDSVTPTPTTPAVVETTGPSGTITGAQSTNSAVGKQIRTDQTPVYHLYIQLVDGNPVLGPEADSGYFVYGSTVALVMADGSKLYLNVDESATTSYKPMTFGTTATTTNWAMSGDTFLVGNQQNFLVCPVSGSSTYWNFYLQTGNDTPGGSCSDYITIHLPCLC